MWGRRSAQLGFGISSPPHRTDKTLFIHISGSEGGSSWEDDIALKLSDVRVLTPPADGCVFDPKGSLEVQMRDGRRLLLSGERPRRFQELAPDGSLQKDVEVGWELRGGTFRAAGGETVSSTVNAITGRARNPLGRDSDYSIPLCRIRTLRFE